MAFFGQTRLADFYTYLKDNQIPVDGVGITADAPAGITIQFQVAATAEQIAWAENAKQEFDWRKMRLRLEEDLYNNFSGLTTSERANLQARAFAIVARTNPEAMAKALLASGIALPLKEVDPNP